MAIVAQGYGIESPVLAPTTVTVVIAGELSNTTLIGVLNPNQLVGTLIVSELTN